MANKIPKPGCLLPYFQHYKNDKSRDMNSTKYPIPNHLIEKHGEIILQIKSCQLKTQKENTYYEVLVTDSREIFPIVLPSTIKNPPQPNTIIKLNSFSISHKGYILNAQMETLTIAGSLYGSNLKHAHWSTYGESSTNINDNNNNNNNNNNSNQLPKSNSLSVGKPAPKPNNNIIHHQLLDQEIINISELSPNSMNWVIEAVVRVKNPIKSWNKGANSEGTLISFELVDSQGGEIKATAFNDACNQLDKELQPGKTYRFSGGMVKTITNHQYNKLSHPCEITFGGNTKICESGNSIEPTNVYSLVQINELTSSQEKSLVDVVGVVSSSEPIQEFTPKGRDKSTKKKSLTLLDDSNSSITATFWGQAAEKLEHTLKNGDIIAIKNAAISNFNNKSLNCGDSTRYDINPSQLDRYGQLRSWYLTHKDNLQNLNSLTISNPNYSSSSNLPKVNANVAHLLGITPNSDDSSKSYIVNGYLSRINSTNSEKKFFYIACPGCSKSRANDPDFCPNENCKDRNTQTILKYKMMLKVIDYTGSVAVEIIGNVGEKLIGMTPEQLEALEALKTPENPKDAATIYFQTKFSPMYQIHLKASTYSENVRFNITSFSGPDYKSLIQQETMVSHITNHLIQKATTASENQS